MATQGTLKNKDGNGGWMIEVGKINDLERLE